MAECKCSFVSNFALADKACDCICPQCRADLELGRMVREMEDGDCLHAPNPYSAIKKWRVVRAAKFPSVKHVNPATEYIGDTPEAALKADRE